LDDVFHFRYFESSVSEVYTPGEPGISADSESSLNFELNRIGEEESKQWELELLDVEMDSWIVQIQKP